MKLTTTLLAAAAVLSGLAQGATTNIAQVPLLNMSGTGTVKPNLMLLYDNSGSMAWDFTPDFVSNDSTSCRSRATLALGTTSCEWGHPPFAAADFNKQYYNPAITYTPPVRADGTSYDSMDSAHTGAWTAVKTDGFNKQNYDVLGNNVSTSDLTGGYPDRYFCDSYGNCVTNTATYRYPDNTYYRSTSSVSYGAPYYYTINPVEYCTDRKLTNCVGVAAGASAPSGYPYPAKVRYCSDRALTTCQSKYITGTYIYPRFGPPTSFLSGYGTVTIGSSAFANPLTISSISVNEGGSNVVITDSAITASTGTNSATKQNQVATAVAASINAKTGLTNEYIACVKSPSSSAVSDCSNFGITLGATNIVAVIPVICPAGYSSKSECSLDPGASRAGWAISAAQPGYPATSIITVSGTTSKKSYQHPYLNSLTFNGSELVSSSIALGNNKGASTVASTIASHLATSGTVAVYGGGNNVTPACDAVGSASLCLVDSTRSTSSAVIATVGDDANGSTTFSVANYASDSITITTAPLAAGGTSFTRTDIVPSRASYPRANTRSDCAGSGSCTYAEEMTNFANWYAYYRTRNQMMKTAVGLAFQPINQSYRVGFVSLSDAAVGNAMTVPKDFTGTDRANWYNKLYGMTLNGSTPMRIALHAVGKMYANLSPYNYSSGNEVVQYPCQQNFTFVTTDGYWNGSAAATVVSNDETENPGRFCLRAKGCVDARSESTNSLADVALYWYNGGSNTGTSSLRSGLEDWTAASGLVPAAAGENTRLHMNTYTLGLGVDGIMSYESDYDTAPIVGGDYSNLLNGVSTGCPWNGNGAYVWPNPQVSSTASTVQERVDDLWHAAVNGHGKYFSASDPQEVVAGLNAALANIQVKIGAAAAAATSTPNISQQDNDIFSDTFTTVKWYGELTDRKVDTVTGVVGTTVLWNTSDTLGAKVGTNTDTRTIKMLDASAGTLKDFSYGAMTATEKAWFDNKCSAMAQCTTLTAAQRVIANSGENLVNWLRGQQQYADDDIFRAYAKTSYVPSGASGPLPIVLGDIASAKPAYLRDPRKNYTIDGYAAFKAANLTRQATVFTAANDGMLHAFKAGAGDSGEEMWAYVPRITMSKLYRQASTIYGTNHQFSADGSPELGDVQIGGSWRTVLVAGLNAGGRGYYALDVTDPTNPQALWEICADATLCPGAAGYGNLGLTFGNPQFGQWRDGSGTLHWVVLLTSGYNNVSGVDGVFDGGGRVADGKGHLFIVDVATGALLYDASTGWGSTSTPSGLAKITAITNNPSADPLITYVYGGDNDGKMWRFDLTAGNPTVLLMGNAGTLQPITSRPEVTQCEVDVTDPITHKVIPTVKRVVAYGTGRLLDVPDVTNVDVQSLYVLKDSGSTISATDWRGTTSMAKQTLTAVAGGSSATWSGSNTAVDLSTQVGWYTDFDKNAGERVNLDPKVVSGAINVVTNLPKSSSSCSVGGTSNVYAFNVCTGGALSSDGQVGSVLSNTSAAVGYIIVRLPSGALKIITTLADGSNKTTGAKPATPPESHKVGWRRVLD